MTKTKRQLRAEAVKRLKDSKPGGVHAAIRQAIGWGWDEMHADVEWRDALVDLLTDDEQPEGDELKAELGKWSDGGEMSEVGKTQDSEIDSEIDTREKLETDIEHWLGSLTAFSVPTSTVKEAILGWLGRMAGIVERERVDDRVNFAERIRLYQRGYDDGRHARGAASFPQHHEDDSREKLEADVLKYYTHTTSTLMWPDDANIKKKWVSVSMDTVLDWLDRAADIRERDFVQYYCAECETAENAALKGDIAVLRDRLDKLSAERDEKAGLLETAFRRCKELEAENKALLAAHADDVERLDAMGEGELLKQVDELKDQLTAKHDYVRREDYDNERKALLDKLVAADDAFKDMKTERDEWKEKALLCEHRLNMELACYDKSIIEALESSNRELAAESKRLKAQRDLFEHDLSETEANFAEEMAETLSLHSKQQAASHQAWVDAVDERDYWRQEVQYCMDAAYPPSHAPERPYNPHVMDYPPSGAYTTPSTMVSAVIDGLRDEKMAEWKGVFEQLSKAEAERDRYRELASKLLDAAHAMQLIADRGLA